jgi:hypothetical protein
MTRCGKAVPKGGKWWWWRRRRTRKRRLRRRRRRRMRRRRTLKVCSRYGLEFFECFHSTQKSLDIDLRLI